MGPFVLKPVGSDHVLAPGGVTLASIFATEAKVVGYVSGVQFNSFYSAILTCWDTRVFGTMRNMRCINLVAVESGEARPCFMAYTSEKILLVNAHAPQPNNVHLDTVFRKMNRAAQEIVPQGETPRHVVMTGDFNDRGRVLDKGQTLLGVRLHPPRMIRTCCYDPGFGMNNGRYEFTGDYVVSDMRSRAVHRILPDGTLTNEDTAQPKVGRSDHEPVVATLELEG